MGYFVQKASLLTIILEKGNNSKGSNAARILKIFKLVAELQTSVYHKLRMVKQLLKLFVVSLPRLVFLLTLCTYD